MIAPVTIVSCLYGNTYDHFIEPWADSIQHLHTKPQAVIVGTDQAAFQRGHHIPHAQVIVSPCAWRNPQAFYLQQAIEAAATEWVWILDIDDTALPDALDGLEDVTEDAWIVGFHRSDGEHYIPPQLTAAEYLRWPGNRFTAGSMIRTAAFREAGGFPDVAFQDFGLWRRMALAGMTFRSSDRAHYNYTIHPGNRTNLELVPERREIHLSEMERSLVS